MLIGSVSAIQDSGLIITLLSYDQGPRRDFDGLRLTVSFFKKHYVLHFVVHLDSQKYICRDFVRCVNCPSMQLMGMRWMLSRWAIKLEVSRVFTDFVDYEVRHFSFIFMLQPSYWMCTILVVLS